MTSLTAGRKARDLAYQKVIGATTETFPSDSSHPEIEVRRYHGKPARNGPVCDVWVTSGMSDLPMRDDNGNPLRRELVFYAQPGGNFVPPLVTIARFPFDEGTFVDHAHTIRTYGALFLPGGIDAILSGDASSITLPHVLLLTPLLRHHQKLSEELEIEGTPVEFLWVVPISQAELELKLDAGTDAVLDVFDKKSHPWIFDPARQSYV